MSDCSEQLVLGTEERRNWTSKFGNGDSCSSSSLDNENAEEAGNNMVPTYTSKDLDDRKIFGISNIISLGRVPAASRHHGIIGNALYYWSQFAPSESTEIL